MEERPALYNLLLLAALLFGSVLAGSVVSAAYLLWLGVEGTFDPQNMHEYMNLSQIRTVLGINQFFSFLLPGLIFIRLNRTFTIPSGSIHQQWIPFLLIGLYFISLPLFQWVYVWNMSLAPPSWWPFSTEAVPAFLMHLVQDASAKGLIGNLLVIAALPAIGEELIFRRIGIPILEKILHHRHLAVLVSALIFAFLHFDFEGLLARTLLGLVLGYAWLYSKKIWVPIVIHFIHNGGQVLLAFLYPETVELDPAMEQAPSIYLAIASAIALFLVYWQLAKYQRVED
jgi:membrane protease YdiL (CAAX protease family)